MAKDEIWMTWKEVGPWKAVGSGRIRKVRRKREAEGNEKRKKQGKLKRAREKEPRKRTIQSLKHGASFSIPNL